MAVRLIATINVYSGLSVDAKPISGIRDGSLFHESDTGLVYRLGGGLWKEDKSVPLSIGQYQAGNAEIRRVMEQMLLEVQVANQANGLEVR